MFNDNTIGSTGFVGMIAQDCGTEFDNLSEAEIDLAIGNLTLEDRQELSRSRFCYLWAIVTHPSTKLVPQGEIAIACLDGS